MPKRTDSTDSTDSTGSGNGNAAATRADRPDAPAPAKTRPQRLTPEARHISYPLVVAAGWSWRLIVVAAAVALLVLGLQGLSMVVVPLAIAALVTAILQPLVRLLVNRVKLPQGIAALVAVLLLIVVVAGLLTFAGAQIASGMSDMLDQAKQGLDQIVNWLHTGPLKLSQEKLDSYLETAKNAFGGDGGSSWVERGTEWAASAGHFLAGLLIALFASYFFLAQGQQMSGFLISLLPRAAQEPTWQAGRRGWISLTSYVRVQVIVAAIDAIGIGLGAAILQLPFVIALTLLVFLTSFIPIVGAIASGAVAVLVALVTHDLTAAIWMLAIVLLVQQLESHVLQPFLMGRAVSLHPLAVLLAVVVGSSLLGIVGALFAVPVLAVANSIVRYYHGYDPFPELGTEPMPDSYRVHRRELPADPDDAVNADSADTADG